MKKITWGRLWGIWMMTGMAIVFFDIQALRHWIFVVVYIVGNFGLLAMDIRADNRRWDEDAKRRWKALKGE